MSAPLQAERELEAVPDGRRIALFHLEDRDDDFFAEDFGRLGIQVCDCVAHVATLLQCLDQCLFQSIVIAVQPVCASLANVNLAQLDRQRHIVVQTAADSDARSD